jgi:hypothetical protein
MQYPSLPNPYKQKEKCFYNSIRDHIFDGPVHIEELIIHIDHNNLYYKERRQLKVFLTRIGPVLPLTPDPLVICFWKWIGWKDYKVPKNRNLESVSAKKWILFSL